MEKRPNREDDTAAAECAPAPKRPAGTCSSAAAPLEQHCAEAPARTCETQAWWWGGSSGCGPTPLQDVSQHVREYFRTRDNEMVLTCDGEVWVKGNNKGGQLGLGDTDDRDTFTRVPALAGREVATIVVKDRYVLALCKSGELFRWGSHIGYKSNVPQPVFDDDTRVKAVACGQFHAAAVTTTGKLYMWGWCTYGGRGNGKHARDPSYPMQVDALADKRVVAVACGTQQTAAVLESGELYIWGLLNKDMLPGSSQRDIPKRVGALLRGRPVAAVACGESHILALLRTGEVFAWGYNDHGQLGITAGLPHATGPVKMTVLDDLTRKPDRVTSPKKVAFFDGMRVASVHCCGNTSAAILQSGELYMWGDNDDGILGTGDCRDKMMPTQVTTNLAGKRVRTISLGSIYITAVVE